MAENFDLTNIITPVKVDQLVRLLWETGYNDDETRYLQQGFTHGFDIGYKGPVTRTSTSKNIPLRVGNEVELWNKLIKEVCLKRVAGPFDQIPFDNFIQSPIGLVPKSGNTGKTRLIFHLSFDFGPEENDKSLNAWTPDELCTVKYRDLDHAIASCLSVHEEMQSSKNKQRVKFDEMEEENNQNQQHRGVFLGITDVQSAFRLVPLSILCWKWLIMSARNPITKRFQYFVDKCLQFGASISCAIFQRFSNALCHITKKKVGSDRITNYLDDFLFVAYARYICNQMIQGFLDICTTVGVPIAQEKTEWSSSIIVFLGILLNGIEMTLGIPEEKRQKALYLLRKIMDKRKTTVKELQTLCGYLNFLNKVVYPGRAFLRRMSAKLSKMGIKTQYGERKNRDHAEMCTGMNKKFSLKPHHHLKLDNNFKKDCQIWIKFLDHHDLRQVVSRPMIDLDMFQTSKDILFFTDASAALELGFGCVYGKRWTFGQWEKGFIAKYEPSIEFLELYALCVGIFTWQNLIRNCRIVVHCDNMAVVSMVNNLTSKCPKCMHLIRLITLNGLLHNRRVSVVYIRLADSKLSDALSRLDFIRFRREGPSMNEFPDKIDSQVNSYMSLFINAQ